MTVGERIKQRRLSLGKSADEIADLLGKNRATVYRYESNEIENLPAKVLSPLAEALETTPAFLMGWTDDPYDYDLDPNNLLSDIPAQWIRVWRDEGLANADIWRRYNLMHGEDEHQKAPDTLIDIEGLSEDKRALVKRILALSDNEVRGLRAIVDQVLALRG